uniref:GrpE protein homolog n=1 Tax=Sus scrofa TaxID=9823 RepID=I3LDV8_PIG
YLSEYWKMQHGLLPVFVPYSLTARVLFTKQKNSGQNSDEGMGQNEQKTDLPSTEKTLMEEKVKVEEQLRETTGKYKQALADTENLQQKSQKLVEVAKNYRAFRASEGCAGSCILEVTQCVPKEEIRDDNPHLKNLYKGIVMTGVQIQKVFTKRRLYPLNPLGEGREPHAGVLVNKVGYKLPGHTLKPALVQVVKEA